MALRQPNLEPTDMDRLWVTLLIIGLAAIIIPHFL
jgi:hypothetical protein